MFRENDVSITVRESGEWRISQDLVCPLRARSASFISHTFLNSAVAHSGHGAIELSTMTSFWPLHAPQGGIFGSGMGPGVARITAGRDNAEKWRARSIKNPLGLR